MATTQSGFEVIDSYGDDRLIVNPVIPGTNAVQVLGGLRAGDPATVLLYVAARWHAEVEPLVQEQGQWGYDKRNIVGGDGWSNHAGGVAEDLNAGIHPRGADTMSDTTKAKIRQIISYTNTLGGGTIVDWGGEWSGVTLDQMHVQLHDEVSRFALYRAATKIRGEIPPPTPTPLPEEPTMADIAEILARLDDIQADTKKIRDAVFSKAEGVVDPNTGKPSTAVADISAATLTTVRKLAK